MIQVTPPTGNNIKEFQLWLNHEGYSVGVADGVFGIKTATAYAHWLMDHPIPGDPIWLQLDRDGVFHTTELPMESGETDVYRAFPEQATAAAKEVAAAVPKRNKGCAGHQYDVYGRITKADYKDNPNGSIKLDHSWIRRHIITVPLWFNNHERRYSVNKAAAPHFTAASAELSYVGYQFSQIGIWVPRHMRWDTSRHLSAHTWGVAVDFDWASNTGKIVHGKEAWLQHLRNSTNFWNGATNKDNLGEVPNGVVYKIMTRWGFFPGGLWPGLKSTYSGYADSMHFELLKWGV